MRKTFLLYGSMSVCFLMIGSLVFGQQNFYVNDNSTTGDVYTTAIGSNSNPGTSSLPFATINYAISQAQSGDIIWVDAGTYNENVFVDKSITFKGAKAGLNPGASLNRNNETIVRPASNDIQNGLVFNVRTTNVTIDGFLIDGDNPAISGGANINGVDVNAGMGVFNQQLFVDGLTVKNNIFKNFNRFGVFLRRLSQPTVTENNLVTNNRFDNINITAGVGMFNNAYATVTNNYFTRTPNGVFFGNGTIASSLEILIANNYIETSGTGVVFGSMSASSLDVSIINNTINPIGSTVSGEGIGVGSLTTSGSLRLINNVISNKQNGIDISSITAPGGVYITGGGVLNSTGVGLFLTAENTTFSISNLTLNNNDVGIDASGIGSAFQLSFSNVLINGGTTGIRFYGTGLTLPGNTLTGVSFLNQTKDYILQTANSFNGQTIDASTVLFEGIAPTSMTLAQLFATEDKLTHRIDFNNVGYFKLKPNEVFVTPNSFAPTLHPSFGVATTAPDINRAVAAAAEGNIIHIAAGTYNGQVFINKGLTLQGEGIGNTIINPGAVSPVTLPGIPPGILYSASGIGNANIKNMTINSGSPAGAGVQYYAISLQTGGEISGCEINGAGTESNNGNGIYIQKDDFDPETLSVLNNHLHHINVLSIKINVPHIVATVNNNTIDVTGSGFGMGLVAGGEPHLIDGLDFIGNKIIGITGFGVKVNCSNSNVTISNNSFEKGANEFYTTPFIQNGGTNPINASCNWFGSADAEFVRSRIQGYNVNYSPWLSDGTDNNIALGFQPVENVCNGRQNKFYVNDNSQTGDVFTTAVGNNSNNGFSTAPFATIGYALTQVQAGDTIYVDAGLYAEDVVVNKSIIIKGVQAGVNPGTSLSRGAESILVPATDDPVNGTIINLLVSNVVIDGFTIDGDNPSISGSVILNGVDINKGHGIASFIDNTTAHNNLIIKNNIIRNVHRYGVFMQSTNALPLNGNLITQNHFDNIPVVSGRQGRAVGLANNGYATVLQNTFTKVHTAIWVNGGFNTPSQTGCSITGNFIQSYRTGIVVGGFSGTASPYLINNNSIATADLSSWNVPGASTDNLNGGILVSNVTSATGMNISNNTITNTYEGLALGRLSTPNCVVNGNTISGSKEIGLYYFNNSATNPLIDFQNNTLVDNDTAIYIHYLGGGAMPVSFSNNSVTGGVVGLQFDGGQISLPGNVLTGLSFTGLSGNYIQLTRNALSGQTIDASSVSFESKIAANMTMAELFATENKLGHKIDYNGVGFIKIKPHQAFVTTSSFNSTLTSGWGTSTTMADINRGVVAATEGDSIYVAAGTYAGQVTIDKGLTLIGEGQDATFIVPPALPYSAPPGPFTETGLIQTTQNIGDVHIRNLSATGDFNNGLQSIIIQSGGSVKNCKVMNGSQGIFFRVESGIKTAVVENNEINAAYIATNFQGSGLTASLINNTIALSNPNFSSGIFAGLDFGPLPQFTATGNKISGFVHSGFFGGSTATLITQNSMVGTGPAIWQLSGSQIQANCNWYGVANAQEVPGKINGNVAYQPWLTNGTDNDVAIGFQSIPGSCDGTPVTATLDNAINVSCFNASNGSISITVSTGKAPYSYAWKKDDVAFSSNEDLTNLAPGTYEVTVTDANGSIVSLSDIVISEPLLLTASASGSNVNCFGGSNGTASVTAEGGTAPYSYLWSNGATTDGISNLPAGNYTVTITDAKGCTVSANYLVTQPPLLTATATPTSTSCFNSISVVANGGTTPYTYLWNNGATTPTISSIAAGTYTVTVTDAQGCATTASATVTANEAFNPSANVVNVSCFGSSNGSITVTNVNAVAPFQYSIDGGLHFQADVTFNGLSAGTYTIAVKDANGCTGFVTKTITQPVQLVASLASVQNTCFGQNSGAISVNVAGGTSGYTYSWTGPNGYTSAQKNISGLATGNYILTVTDSKGCVASLSQTVTTTNEIIVNTTLNQVACKGETNGSILLTTSGGSSNGNGNVFNYLWNTGATGSSILNLGAGNYSVTITDIGTGCSINRNFTIIQPATLVNLSTAKTNATGCASLGTITATGSGGTVPYQYKLDNGSYQSSSTFTGLYAGNYTVWVKDANNCTKSAVVSITDNGSDEFEGNNSKNQAKTINVGTDVFARIALATDAADWFKFTTASSGNYTLTLTHPSASFTFNLYATGNNTPALTPTSTNATSKQYTLAGNTTYYISITGGLSYQCYKLNITGSQMFTRSSQQEQSVEEAQTDLFEVKVLGNPSSSYFNIAINSSSNEKMKMRIVDVSGRIIEQKENLAKNQVMKIGEKYIRGAYFVEIIQGNNRKTVRLVKL